MAVGTPICRVRETRLVARLVANVAAVISGRAEGLTYQKVADQGGEQEP